MSEARFPPEQPERQSCPLEELLEESQLASSHLFVGSAPNCSILYHLPWPSSPPLSAYRTLLDSSDSSDSYLLASFDAHSTYFSMTSETWYPSLLFTVIPLESLSDSLKIWLRAGPLEGSPLGLDQNHIDYFHPPGQPISPLLVFHYLFHVDLLIYQPYKSLSAWQAHHPCPASFFSPPFR